MNKIVLACSEHGPDNIVITIDGGGGRGTYVIIRCTKCSVQLVK